MQGKRRVLPSFVMAAIACAACAAAPAAASPPSPPEEIAAGAVACVEALRRARPDRDAIEAAGWRADEGGGSFSRSDSNVRIDLVPMGAGMCVISAYGERPDSFDAIAAAIESQLAARFGRDMARARAMGDESSFSRGQGFTIGNRVSVLSSERRPDGLSIRVTAMAMPR